MSVVLDDERLEQLDAWVCQVGQEKVRRYAAKAAAEKAVTSGLTAAADVRQLQMQQAQEGLPPVMWLPDELVVKIFGCLTSVRDLVRVTAVCTKWYDLGNDEFLYRKFLSNPSSPAYLPPAELEARLSRVKSYKTVYMQIYSKLLVPMTGMYLCGVCDSLFWAAKNVSLKKCKNGNAYDRHQPSVAITPETLIPMLLKKKKKEG